jgi:hypothetical protein
MRGLTAALFLAGCRGCLKRSHAVALLASPTRCRKEELTALLKRVLVDNRVQFIFFSYEAQKKERSNARESYLLGALATWAFQRAPGLLRYYE